MLRLWLEGTGEGTVAFELQQPEMVFSSRCSRSSFRIVLHCSAGSHWPEPASGKHARG
jgi:hypothetical protein